MNLTRTLLSCAVLSLGGCALDSADPADPNQTDSSNLLPDGTTGVDHVIRHGTPADLPWTAKNGLKYVSDDFAIGPALAKVAELATPDASAEWANNVVPFCVTDVANNSLGLTSAERTQLDRLSQGARADHAARLSSASSCTAASKPASYVNYIHWNTTPNQTIPGQGHDGWTIDLEYNFWQGDVYHETGHALGYMHEQQRLDRANFVNYYPECVTPVSDRGNFDQNTSTELTPYDIHSIMEYSQHVVRDVRGRRDDAAVPAAVVRCAEPGDRAGVGSLQRHHAARHDHRSAERVERRGHQRRVHLVRATARHPRAERRARPHMVSGDFDGDGYDDLAVRRSASSRARRSAVRCSSTRAR